MYQYCLQVLSESLSTAQSRKQDSKEFNTNGQPQRNRIGLIYRVNIKTVAPPPRLLLIFQRWVQIFAGNFTWLSNNQIYTLSPSLVEIYQKMTKLCCFSQDNPPFSVCERHAEVTESKQVHWEDWVALKLSTFEPTGLSHLGHHAGKVP